MHAPDVSVARIGLTKMDALRRRGSLLGLGVILAFLGAGCGGQLEAKALLQQSKTLRSVAAEGALLAEDAVSGKTTRIYTHEHAFELSTTASQIEAALEAATTEPELEPALGQLAVLASEISADLERLGEASTDEQRTLIRELEGTAEASRRIGEGLT